MGLVLYGGTAVALRLGHRQSVDFDFFTASKLDKRELGRVFAFMGDATVVQDGPDTLVVVAAMPSGDVKVSFFGGLTIGRVGDPWQTRDGVLLVASPEDLLATKLKATLDPAEAKDYIDIDGLIAGGASLPLALAAFARMFRSGPAEVLRALGYFEDGDLASLGEAERARLRAARDQVRDLPDVMLTAGSLAIPTGPCDPESDMTPPSSATHHL